MAEAALLLSGARAEVAAERGAEAVQRAKAAKDAFEKDKNASGVAEASLVEISALILNGQASDAVSAIASQAGKTKDQSHGRRLDLLKAEALLAQGRDAEALKLAESGEEASQGAEDKQNAGRALLVSVKVHLSLGKSKPAVEAAEKAAACFNSAGDDSGEAAAWTAVMNARFAAGDHEGATSASYAALALYGELRDQIGEAVVLLKFSEAQLKRKSFSEALPAATHALRYFRKNGGGKLELEALDVAVAAYSSTGQGSEAVSLAKQSVASARRSGNKRHEGLALLSLARAHSTQKWPDAAAQAANDALYIFQQLGDKETQASTLQTMARIYLAGLWYETAQESAANALNFFRELGNDDGAKAMEDLQTEIREAEEKEYGSQLEEQQKWETQHELDLLKLAEVANAMRLRDKVEFKEKFDELVDNSTLTDEDFKKYMSQELDDQIWYYANRGYNKKGDPSTHMVISYQYLYNQFRLTGMHYGPGFRLLHYGGAEGRNQISSTAWGCLTLFGEPRANDPEPNHSWEGLSCYHAGMLDCGLQAGAARGFMTLDDLPLPTIESKEKAAAKKRAEGHLGESGYGFNAPTQGV